MSNQESTTQSTTNRPTNQNGVKLPYFHRVLSEDDQKILGDITPKKIDDPTMMMTIDSTSSTTATASLNGGSVKQSMSVSSAWNQGTTWEERNCTKWAKDTIIRLFSEGYDMKSNNHRIEILHADEVSGNAQITHSRGKPRYLYELSFHLHLEITETSSLHTISGVKVNVIDAINDQLDDMELEIIWGDKKPNTNTINQIKSCVQSQVREYILKQMKNFEEEFRNI